MLVTFFVTWGQKRNISLPKHYDMKTYAGVEMKVHASLTIGGDLDAAAAPPPLPGDIMQWRVCKKAHQQRATEGPYKNFKIFVHENLAISAGAQPWFMQLQEDVPSCKVLLLSCSLSNFTVHFQGSKICRQRTPHFRVTLHFMAQNIKLFLTSCVSVFLP